MGKTIAIILLVALMLLTALFTINAVKTSRQPVKPPEEKREKVNQISTATINSDNGNYQVAWFITKPKDTALYSNLQDKKTAQEIQKDKSCRAIINAGFYTKENTHIGLLISNGQEVSEYQPNQTFNGFFSIGQDQIPRIASSIPSNTSPLALQSGPILIKNSKAQTLEIKNDAAKRRVIIGITDEGNLIFLAIYDSQSAYQGPYLGDLPFVLTTAEKEIKVRIVDALNLDGGTASAFLTPDNLLNEASPIGSYFCIR